MNAAQYLMPILFLVSSLIRDTYGKPHVSGSAHYLGPMLVPGSHHTVGDAPSVPGSQRIVVQVPGSHHIVGDAPSVPGSQHIVVQVPGSHQIVEPVSGPHQLVVSVDGSHGMVDPVHAQHNVVVHRPVVHTIVVTASPPHEVDVPFNEFHQVVVPGPEVKVKPPETGWHREVEPEPEMLRDREPKCSSSDNNICSEVALDNGYMDEKFLLKTITIDKGSSCRCCGLCGKRPKCLSLAFNKRTGECRLYRAVAGYTTFTRDDDWKYMISGHSHKKSRHEQFCRRDHDCSAAGDACRGRICTNKKRVLCSTIYDVFMRRGASGKGLGDEIIDTYGWIDGGEKRIVCTLNKLSPGYTVLFRNRVNFKFNEDTVKRYNTELEHGEMPYSNLALAETLRRLAKGGTYRLQLYSILQGTTKPKSFLQLSVPKEYPVISDKQRPASTHDVKITDLGRKKVSPNLLKALSLPYLAHVNGPLQGHGKRNKHTGLLSLHSYGAGWGHLGLARSDGEIHLFAGNHKECALLMRD